MEYNVGIITVNDKLARGEGINIQEEKVREYLESHGWIIKYASTICGDWDIVKKEFIKCSDELNLQLVLTIGGAGYSEGSFVPEITLDVIDREVRGIPEFIRTESTKTEPNGCLSRGVAGLRKKTFIVNLPGNAKAAIHNLSIGEAPIKHVIDMVWPDGTLLSCN